MFLNVYIGSRLLLRLFSQIRHFPIEGDKIPRARISFIFSNNFPKNSSIEYYYNNDRTTIPRHRSSALEIDFHLLIAHGSIVFSIHFLLLIARHNNAPRCKHLHFSPALRKSMGIFLFLILLSMRKWLKKQFSLGNVTEKKCACKHLWSSWPHLLIFLFT